MLLNLIAVLLQAAMAKWLSNSPIREHDAGSKLNNS